MPMIIVRIGLRLDSLSVQFQEECIAHFFYIHQQYLTS